MTTAPTAITTGASSKSDQYSKRLEDIDTKFNLVLERYHQILIKDLATNSPTTQSTAKRQLELINKDLFLLGSQVESAIQGKILSLDEEDGIAAVLRQGIDSEQGMLTTIQGSDAAAIPLEHDTKNQLIGHWVKFGYYVAATLLAANYIYKLSL